MSEILSKFLMLLILFIFLDENFLKGSKTRTKEEAVDVIYHLFVLLSAKKIKFNEIEKEILKRKNVRR